MDEFILMAEVQAMLFVYMLVGFWGEHKGILNPTARKGLTDLLVAILLPSMVFNSFHQEFSFALLKQGSLMILVASALSIFSLGMGKIIWKKYPQNKRAILQYGTLVANSGFAGLAVIASVYGEAGILLASLFIIPNRVFMWTAGVSMFQQGEKPEHIWKTILLNPGIVAVFFGLARMILNPPIPVFLDSAIAALGNCTAPISMVIIGGILYHVNWRTVFSLDSIYASVVRLGVLPIIALILMNTLQFPPLETAIAVILTGMPMGSTTAILAEKYGADGTFGSQCVFVTTLLSLFTVPLLTLLLPK